MKEGTQIKLPLDIIHDLTKGQPSESRELLHHQICKKLDGYHSINTFSASQSHSVHLKVIFQPSPELLYGVMLLPYGQDLTSSQLSAKSHDTLHGRAILKEQQNHLSKGWAFRCSSAYWYAFASPEIILKLYLLLVKTQFLSLSAYAEDIVTFGVNQYLVKSCFFQHISQVFGTIGTIEGDRKLSQVYSFLPEELQHLLKHFPEYLWLGGVGSALLSHRPDAQRNYPVINLDGYGDDVLTTNHFLVFATIPAVSETYDSTQPVYHCVINAHGDTCSGESRWTHGKSLLDNLDCFLTASNQEHPSKQVDAPGVDSSIYLVLVYLHYLSHLVRSEYLEYMAKSQHQQYLYGFMLVLPELAVKKLLKWLQNSDNILLHLSLLVGVLAFSYTQPIRRLSFSFIVNSLVVFS